MYRLVLYYLTVLMVGAALAGLFGIAALNPANLAFSIIIILAVCMAANKIFARAFGAIPNIESVYITALILALIISPVDPTDTAGIGFIVFASLWAMASKYIFALGNKHVFNPAAFGVALAGIMTNQAATWWITSNPLLLAFVFIGGVLIVRKIRRTDLVIAFSIAALAAIVFTTNGNPLTAITMTLFHSSFFFLALVMLTEPLTMPPSRMPRIAYGALVGILFAPNIHLGSFYFTPEIALLAGNLFVYFTSPKRRFLLTLVEKSELADSTNEFVFTPDYPISFRPGQYIEWTLDGRAADNRGNRRYFTIASSPTEPVVRLGVRFYTHASTFKQELLAIQPGDTLTASHAAGDFVLPSDPKQKLVFIAGGIGVTPFRSMVQYLIDTKDARQVTLLYSNKTFSEIAYKDFFDRTAQSIGMKTVYALTDEPVPIPGTHAGFIDAALIKQEIPDYLACVFYISGPHGMVSAFTKTLNAMGVPRRKIKTDYFPGFA